VLGEKVVSIGMKRRDTFSEEICTSSNGMNTDDGTQQTEGTKRSFATPATIGGWHIWTGEMREPSAWRLEEGDDTDDDDQNDPAPNCE
jgi:hypothetical protein